MNLMKFVVLLTVLAMCGEALCISLDFQPSGTLVSIGSDAPERLCTREGIMCKDCNTLVSCKKDRVDKFSYDVALYCPHYAPCDETKLACTPIAENGGAEGGLCRYKAFECPIVTADGVEHVFPDPYSCIQYHGCLKDESFHYTCPEGSSFSMTYQNCSDSWNNSACLKSPVDACTKPDTAAEAIENTDYQKKCTQDPKDTRIIYPVISEKTSTSSTSSPIESTESTSTGSVGSVGEDEEM